MLKQTKVEGQIKALEHAAKIYGGAELYDALFTFFQLSSAMPSLKYKRLIGLLTDKNIDVKVLDYIYELDKGGRNGK